MKKGFTLIEMMVVVLIIGILSSVALPQYNKAVKKSRYAEVLLNAKAMMTGIQTYMLTSRACPTQLADLDVKVDTSNSKYFSYAVNQDGTLKCAVVVDELTGDYCEMYFIYYADRFDSKFGQTEWKVMSPTNTCTDFLKYTGITPAS